MTLLVIQGMRREKSLIDTSVSDDQKKAIYDRLVKQQLNEQYSKTAQRQKQEEEVYFLFSCVYMCAHVRV